MNLYKQDKTTYELNEINRKNTYLNTELIELTIGSSKLGIGMWPAEHPNTGEEYPMPALIVWTPEGWLVLDRVSPIWDNNLTMYTGSDDEDLRTYMWYLEESWSKSIQAYLTKIGENTVPLENWKKVFQLMATASFGGNRLNFERSL